MSVLAAALVGCAGSGGVNAPVDAASLQRQAFELKSAYAGAERTAIVYLERPRCTEPRTVTLCSTQAVANTMTKYRNMARIGVDGAEDAARSFTGNTTALQAAIKGATEAVASFQQIATAYQGEK